MSPNERNPERVTLTLRVKNAVEHETLIRAAEKEGFSTLTACMLYHLRNQAKQTLADDDK